MKEQDAAHPFDERPDWKQWKDGLKQLGFFVEYDEESKYWFAQREHDKAKIIVTSEKKETLANEIILSYQALLMHATTELTRLRSELQQEREKVEQAVKIMQMINGLVDAHDLGQYIPQGNIDSFIKKAKLIN